MHIIFSVKGYVFIMCGIVGFKGKKDAISVLVSSLEKLEYRGYDSSGIAYVCDGDIHIQKEVGKIHNLKEKVDLSIVSTCGIAHTRWATHGKSTKENSHPHQVGKITLVHNGIIENYGSLKKELLEKDYHFLSDTDTEVAAALLDYFYQDTKDMILSIKKLFDKLEGSYAFGIICKDDLESLYVVKKDSPLIVAESEIGKFIASDVPAILDYTNSYYVLEDYEFAKLNNEITFYDRFGNIILKRLKKYDASADIIDKGNFEHFMLKEIYEQPEIVADLIDYYVADDFGKFRETLPDFSKYSRIYIVACGSAYHAGLVLKKVYEKYLNIEVSVYLASEFRYQKLFLGPEVLTMFISQSGETADTLKSLLIAKENNSDTLAIVNVYDSSIARHADYVLYTRAGSEIAVATTKGYTSQILVGVLIAVWIAKLEIDFSLKIIMKNILSDSIYFDIAKSIYQENHIFFIGRGVDYGLSMEGALKLKEISYIHAESYAAGELKHGTISLIEDGSYVFGIVTDDALKDKTISNLKEVIARGAKVIVVVREDFIDDFSFAEFVVCVPKVFDIYQALVAILPLQMIAYYTAKLRGCDIDKPKKLAKSVTVE